MDDWGRRRFYGTFPSLHEYPVIEDSVGRLLVNSFVYLRCYDIFFWYWGPLAESYRHWALCFITKRTWTNSGRVKFIYFCVVNRISSFYCAWYAHSFSELWDEPAYKHLFMDGRNELFFFRKAFSPKCAFHLQPLELWLPLSPVFRRSTTPCRRKFWYRV